MHGDGMPRLLTSDEFFGQVEQAAVQQEQEAAAKEARSDQMEKYKRDLARWKTQEDAKAARNEAKTRDWKQAVAEFKAAKQLSKERSEKWTGGKEPVRGALEKSLPKPKVPRKNAVDVEPDEEGWEDEDEDD